MSVIEIKNNRPDFSILFNNFIKSYKPRGVYSDVYCWDDEDAYYDALNDWYYGKNTSRRYPYSFGLGDDDYWDDDDYDEYDKDYISNSIMVSHNEADDFMDYTSYEDDKKGIKKKKRKRHHSSKNSKSSNSNVVEEDETFNLSDLSSSMPSGSDVDKLLNSKRSINFYEDIKLPLKRKVFKSFNKFYNYILDLGLDIDDASTATLLRRNESYCCFDPKISNKLIVADSYGSLYWEATEDCDSTSMWDEAEVIETSK